MQRQLFNDPYLTERIITKFQLFLLPPNPQQISPRIPKFINMLHLQADSSIISYHQQVQNLLQKLLLDLNKNYIDFNESLYKSQMNLLTKLTKSLKKFSKNSIQRNISVEKGLIILTIIHCLLQQTKQQISYSLKDTLLIFLNKFQILIQQQAHKKNAKSVKKIQETFNSTIFGSNKKVLYSFKQKIFNSSKSISMNHSAVSHPDLHDIRAFKSQQNVLKGILNLDEIENTQIFQNQKKQSQPTSKQLVLFDTIVKPYILYLKKLIALSEYYASLKSNQDSFSVQQLWIPVNLLNSITNVSLNFTKIGRYYMAQYGQHIVMINQLFCMDVVSIYGKIFKNLDKNIKEIQDIVKFIIKQNFQDLLRNGHQRKANQLKKSAQQIKKLQFNILDHSLKKQFNKIIRRHPRLLERVSQIHKILQQINKKNEGLLQLFFCRYFHPKIKYMKYPQLIENCQQQHPLIYELHKINQQGNSDNKFIWLCESNLKNTSSSLISNDINSYYGSQNIDLNQAKTTTKMNRNQITSKSSLPTFKSSQQKKKIQYSQDKIFSD